MRYEDMTGKDILLTCCRYILKDGLSNAEGGTWCTFASDMAKETGIPVLEIVSRAYLIESMLSSCEAVGDIETNIYYETIFDKDTLHFSYIVHDDWVFDAAYYGEYCPNYDVSDMGDEECEWEPGCLYDEFMSKIDTEKYWDTLKH